MNRGTHVRFARAARLSAALVLAAVVAGCGASIEGGGSVTAGTGSGDTLEGRTFVSTSVTLDGADAPLVEGTRLTLTFDRGRLSADAGCNGMSGALGIEGDTLVVGDLAGTMMGCAAPLMEQDAWVSRFLGDRPTFALDGTTLTLTGGGRVVTLLDKKVATPDLPLEGTTWTLDGIVTGTGPSSAVSSVPQGVTAKLTFGPAGADLVVCNTFHADVETAAGTVTLGEWSDVPPTKPCPSGPAELARTVQATLSGPLTVEIDAARLTLTGPSGGLMFTGSGG